MVRSLIESDTLEGLSLSEVTHLLGPPQGVEDSLSQETINLFGLRAGRGAHAFYVVDEDFTDPDGFPLTGTLAIALDSSQSVESADVWYGGIWE